MAERRTLLQLTEQEDDPDAKRFAEDFLAAYASRYQGPSSPADVAEERWQSAIDAWLTFYGDRDVEKAQTRAIQELRSATKATRRDS